MSYIKVLYDKNSFLDIEYKKNKFVRTTFVSCSGFQYCLSVINWKICTTQNDFLSFFFREMVRNTLIFFWWWWVLWWCLLLFWWLLVVWFLWLWFVGGKCEFILKFDGSGGWLNSASSMPCWWYCRVGVP